MYFFRRSPIQLLPCSTTRPYLALSCVSFSLQQLSFNISIDHNSNMLLAIATKLSHNNNQHLPFMSHDLGHSKGQAGVTEVKSVNFFKKFQLKQKTSYFDVVRVYESSLVGALSLFIGKSSKVIKGHFRVKFKNIFKKSLKINGRC